MIGVDADFWCNESVPAGKGVIAVVIPAYKVSRHILDVIRSMPACVSHIYVVDDACPDRSGELVREECQDPRVTILFNKVNLGVGGAVKHGYRAAVADGADVAVKVDGDGQMDPALIPLFVAPILSGRADYTKGNRFFDVSVMKKMPFVRLFGNAVLSFLSKLSTGYWGLFDPTNGYTALSCRVVPLLALDKISNRYFFETDMLFRLNSVGAVVRDIPMAARYADEVSNLRISKVIPEFSIAHLRNFLKRIFYNYYLRDFSIASIALLAAVPLLCFGIGFGTLKWWVSIATGVVATSGEVMLAVLPLTVGFHLLLAFVSYDMMNVAKEPLTGLLGWQPLGNESAEG